MEMAVFLLQFVRPCVYFFIGFIGSSMDVAEVAHLVLLRITKCVYARSEFDGLRAEGILHNWEASLRSSHFKVAREILWVPPMEC